MKKLTLIQSAILFRFPSVCIHLCVCLVLCSFIMCDSSHDHPSQDTELPSKDPSMSPFMIIASFLPASHPRPLTWLRDWWTTEGILVCLTLSPGSCHSTLDFSLGIHILFFHRHGSPFLSLVSKMRVIRLFSFKKIVIFKKENWITLLFWKCGDRLFFSPSSSVLSLPPFLEIFLLTSH